MMPPSQLKGTFGIFDSFTELRALGWAFWQLGTPQLWASWANGREITTTGSTAIGHFGISPHAKS